MLRTGSQTLLTPCHDQESCHGSYQRVILRRWHSIIAGGDLAKKDLYGGPASGMKRSVAVGLYVMAVAAEDQVRDM
jgi:hypothetical protein